MLEKERKNHKLRILIIDMINECERRANVEINNMERFRNLPIAHANSKANFSRYQKIKHYLISRY